MTSPVTLHHTEDHVLSSQHVGRDLHLWIGKPVAGFAPSGEPPHVLWVLDGDLFFGTALELTRLMHQLYGELPPVLVVGVGYGTDDPRVQGELRARDFTPTADRGYGAMRRQMDPQSEPVLPEGERMGGAAAFLRFLVEEARPYVEGRFTVAAGRGTLFGTSLGGLFAVWSLLSQPGAFDHTIAVSPALWWDGKAVLKLAQEGAKDREDVPGRLFMAVGALEEPEGVPFLSRFGFVSNVRALAAHLSARNYPSLEVQAEVFDGETHTSMVAVGLTRGLRAFLRGKPPSIPASASSPLSQK